MFIEPNGLEGKHYLILYGEGTDKEDGQLLYDLAKARQKQLEDNGDTATVREGTDEKGKIVPAPVKSKKDIENQLEEESPGSVDGIIYYGHGTWGALAVDPQNNVFVEYDDFVSIARDYGDRLAKDEKALKDEEAQIELHSCFSGGKVKKRDGSISTLAQEIGNYFGCFSKGYTRKMKFTPTKTEPYNENGKNKGKFKKFKPDPSKKVKPKKRKFYDPFKFNL